LTFVLLLHMEEHTRWIVIVSLQSKSLLNNGEAATHSGFPSPHC
jgi:hypothetical protein